MHIDELYFRTERLRKHAEELGELLDADVIIRCVTDSKGIRGIDDATKTLLRGSTIYFTIVIEKETNGDWEDIFTEDCESIEETDSIILSLICGAKLALGKEV